eukprot:Plantae.Rhodophyta-Purpureofilum_apyrenoidigerum.ctg1515.p1 GENE.Plantae.Rhodophyta-Purpureofilum_apyrenoidigerum.ctg1515~~Plantae.Rhodophyta-Purpureofilum_apyrenoidigerum.ctg1515.p1  ORF type:complete len:397 (+),score=53.90 Plantae.Rhodophyta-Purpureofilum_apyrenoidigerum.ctg1515:205-1395(+)
MIPWSRPQDKYDPIGKIGEGTYGLVYKARAIESSDGNNQYVAVKKFKSFKAGDGISPTAIREIKLLRELSHDYVVNLMDVMLDPEDKALYLVFDYADHDLLEMIRCHHARQCPTMDPVTVKSLLWQILHGMNYLHRNWIIHRDLKPSNILVTGTDKPPEEQGCVKIADFGLARLFQAPLRPFTDVDAVVVTIWYRAPELLLGAKHYTKAIDLWAIGCIFAELITSKPLFKGDEKLKKGDDRNPFQADQVDKIFKTLGKPNPQLWPGVVDLLHWQEAQNWQNYPNVLHERVPGLRLGSAGFDLLAKLLEYDPSRRITAAQALDHPYFKEEPFPQKCAFVNGQDPYKPRPVSPLDPKKDSGWATGSGQRNGASKKATQGNSGTDGDKFKTVKRTKTAN